MAAGTSIVDANGRASKSRRARPASTTARVSVRRISASIHGTWASSSGFVWTSSRRYRAIQLCIRRDFNRRSRKHEEAPAEAILERRLPLERGGLEDDASDEVRVPSTDLQRDRPTHRVAHRYHLPARDQEPDRRGRIVGAVFERELLFAADAPTMAPMVDRDHRVASAQLRIDRAPLQIRTCSPSVQQQHDRRVRWSLVMADERLSAALES